MWVILEKEIDKMKKRDSEKETLEERERKK